MTDQKEHFDNFQKYFKAIKSYRAFRGRTGKDFKITVEIVDKKLFPDYQKLLSKVNSDIERMGQKGSKNSKNFKYGTYTFEEIISVLKENFKLEQVKDNVQLTDESVRNFFEKSTRDKPQTLNNSTGIIFLATSSYQQNKELDVKPKGIFVLDLNKKRAILHYFRNPDSESQKFEGKVEYQNNLLYITLPEKNPRKMYVLSTGEIENLGNIKYLRGAYTSGNNSEPEAGMVFCERAESFEDAKLKFSIPIPMEMQYEILHKQYKIEKKEINDDADLEEHPLNKIIAPIRNKFFGTYHCYYLSNQSQGKILIATMKVLPSGSVFFYCQENDPMKRFKGYLFVREDNKLYFRITYLPLLNTYKYFITLIKQKDHDSLFFGAFGGDFQDASIPLYGRVVFKKINEEFDFTNSIIVTSVLVKDGQQMSEFCKNHLQEIKDETLNFLRGVANQSQHHDVADSPFHIFKESDYDLGNVIKPSNALSPVKRPFEDLVLTKEIDSYKGVYRGFIMDTFNVNPQHRIQEIIFEIFANGNVRAKSKHKETYQGKFGWTPDGRQILLTICENETEILRHNLQRLHLENENPSIEMRGTYSGLGMYGSPVGGRIILRKAVSDEKTFDSLMPHDYDLSLFSSPTEPSKEEKEALNLIPFFMGVNDTMIEGSMAFNETFLMPRFHSSPNELVGASGLFKVFRLRNRRKSISIVPLVIYDDGKVLMKSSKERETYLGKIVLTNNEIISILFYKRGQSESYSYLIFNKSNDPITKDNNEKFIGFFTSWMPHDNRVFSTRIVLKFQSHEVMRFKDEPVHEIYLPKWPYGPSLEYEKYNINGVMDYLASEENNMLRGGRGARIRSLDDEGKYVKKFHYGEVFFLAAIQRLKNGERDEAKKLWKHAKSQGTIEQKFVKRICNENNIDIKDLE